MTKWILKWNDLDGDSCGEESFDSKEAGKRRLEDIKFDVGDDIEWDLMEGEECPCCKSIVKKGTIEKRGVQNEGLFD